MNTPATVLQFCLLPIALCFSGAFLELRTSERAIGNGFPPTRGTRAAMRTARRRRRSER